MIRLLFSYKASFQLQGFSYKLTSYKASFQLQGFSYKLTRFSIRTDLVTLSTRQLVN